MKIMVKKIKNNGRDFEKLPNSWQIDGTNSQLYCLDVVCLLDTVLHVLRTIHLSFFPCTVFTTNHSVNHKVLKLRCNELFTSVLAS